MNLRHHVPLLLVAAVAVALVTYGPVAQPANYHQFADGSVMLGTPHAQLVLSATIGSTRVARRAGT